VGRETNIPNKQTPFTEASADDTDRFQGKRGREISQIRKAHLNPSQEHLF
jgi:predicted RNA-binding protein YlqC (UPF0109 family)